MTIAAIGDQIVHKAGYRGEIDRVNALTPILASYRKPSLAQDRQMGREPARRDLKFGRQYAGGKALRAFCDQATEDAKPRLARQRGELRQRNTVLVGQHRSFYFRFS